MTPLPPGEKDILYFVADAMCSWCWGFKPVIEQVIAADDRRYDVQLLLGGLRPGLSSEAMSASMRRMLRHHWREVAKVTGQSFDYSLLDRDFLYDTEPAARAVWTVRSLVMHNADLDPSLTWQYFYSLQQAFYEKGQLVTESSVHLDLLPPGIDAELFTELYDRDETRQQLYAEFARVVELGVQGFPGVLYKFRDTAFFLAQGYMPYEQLNERIEAACAEAERRRNN